MLSLGTLCEVPDLRSVWPNEALDFTPWLVRDDNISLLSAAVDMDIVVEESESPVGDFKADIVASEAGTKRKIIIENQLEDTNHDHLGKLITYASGKSADVVIWLVKRAREEHKAAIEWLNSHTDEGVGFFLCEIKLYRIDDSSPAVKFDVVERPNDWQKVLRAAGNESPRHRLRLEYWSAFNDYAFAKPEFAREFTQRKASVEHYMELSIGKTGYHISLTFIQRRNEIGAEFYIADDQPFFSSLMEKREEIESALGFDMEWQELPSRKASRIRIRKSANLFNRDEWESQFEWLSSMALKIKSVFKGYL
ncbi:MAG: DUF4268 domain-containing protein [Selenomonas sp.]|nr:DUF4268 domain-containing protein [Selenomonas sp.]